MKPPTHSKPKQYTGGVAEKSHAVTKLSDLSFQTGLQVGMAMRERAQLEKDKQQFQASSQQIMQQLLLAQAQQSQMGAAGQPSGAPATGQPPTDPAMGQQPAGPDPSIAPDISKLLPQPPMK